MDFSSPHRLLPAALLLLAGCAAAGPFPSLAPLSVEREADAEPQPALPEIADAAMVTQIATLMATARQGNAEFDTAYRTAQPAVERAGIVGSESWVEAQQAVSRLESARTPTVAALAELDRLALANANQPANLEVANAALAEAQAMAERQRSLIGELQGRLSAP